MLKILKAKARKNKKENNIVIGAKGTGMVRTYIKPIVTGEDLLNSLLIRGEYAGYDTHFSDGEIYIALQKCKRLITVPYCDNDIQCAYVSPLSARQGYCSDATIKLIMDNKYNHALHEFEDCIDDYGKGKERYLTKNEFILYNCILTCFITRLEEQAENLETMKMVAEQSLRLWENRDDYKHEQA